MGIDSFGFDLGIDQGYAIGADTLVLPEILVQDNLPQDLFWIGEMPQSCSRT
jgi:hypothetical protein